MKQLLQYLDVNLKIYTLETVVFHAGINDTLKYNITANHTDNLFSSIKCIVDKCRKFVAKNTLISGLVYNNIFQYCYSALLEVLEKICEKRNTDILIYVLIIETLDGHTFVKAPPFTTIRLKKLFKTI